VQRNDHINVLTDMETDLYIAAMVKDAWFTEQSGLEHAPFVQQISHRVCIL